MMNSSFLSNPRLALILVVISALALIGAAMAGLSWYFLLLPSLLLLAGCALMQIGDSRSQRVIEEIIRCLEASNRGDLERRLVRTGATGRMQRVVDQINLLLDTSDAFVREAGSTAQAASDGKYYRKFLVTGLQGRFRQGASSINDVSDAMKQQSMSVEVAAQEFDQNVAQLVNALIAASTQLQSTSEASSAMAAQSVTRAGDVSNGATEASSNVLTVAGAAEELSASIAEISRQVGDAVSISGQAVEEADATNRTVTELSHSSEKIGEIVRVITDIAEQTNLLALNASIEAARAGDAGRGFAVVASEVKELATQTANATQQIAQQINDIQNESGGAAKAIERISHTISRMNEINRAIAAATEEQNEATREIAQSVQYASSATQQVTEAIAGVTEAAVDAGHAASDVLAASTDIRSRAEGLQQQVQQFLALMQSKTA